MNSRILMVLVPVQALAPLGCASFQGRAAFNRGQKARVEGWKVGVLRRR